MNACQYGHVRTEYTPSLFEHTLSLSHTRTDTHLKHLQKHTKNTVTNNTGCSGPPVCQKYTVHMQCTVYNLYVYIYLYIYDQEKTSFVHHGKSIAGDI